MKKIGVKKKQPRAGKVGEVYWGVSSYNEPETVLPIIDALGGVVSSRLRVSLMPRIPQDSNLENEVQALYDLESHYPHHMLFRLRYPGKTNIETIKFAHSILRAFEEGQGKERYAFKYEEGKLNLEIGIEQEIFVKVRNLYLPSRTIDRVAEE